MPQAEEMRALRSQLAALQSLQSLQLPWFARASQQVSELLWSCAPSLLTSGLATSLLGSPAAAEEVGDT